MTNETNQQPPARIGSILDDPTSERFQALLRDPRLFIRQLDPFTASLWMALLKPGSEVLTGFKRRMVEQPPQSDEPGEGQSPDDPMAIVLLGETVVAQAILGSSKAQNTIADRIEGKVGVRQGDEDPDAVKRREESMQVVRTIVTAFANASAESRKGEDAKIVDARPVDEG